MRLLLCFSLVLMSACTSVPLGTMAKFATFGKDDALAINPEHLAARVTLDQDIEIIPSEHLSIKMTIKDIDGITPYDLTLEEVSKSQARESSFWGQSDSVSYITTLKPTAAAIVALNELKARIARPKIGDEQRSLSISANTHFDKEALAGIDEVTVSLALQFTQEEGFFTVIDKQVIVPEDIQTEESAE